MAIEVYDWRDPDVLEHWASVRARIVAGCSVGVKRDAGADLRSARKQLARCERDAEEWRAVIAKMERGDA